MENKLKFRLLISFIIVIILIIPIRVTLNDGGTVVYNALSYKVIVWHEEDDFYSGGYHTGIDVYSFPSNFKTVKYYSEVNRLIDGEYVVKNIDVYRATCGEGKVLFYSDDTYNYYFDCNYGYEDIIEFRTGERENVYDAFRSGRVTLNEFEKYGISYTKILISEDTENVSEDILENEEVIEEIAE